MMIFLVICPPSTLPPKQFTKFLFDFFVILKGRKTRIKKNKLGNNNIKKKSCVPKSHPKRVIFSLNEYSPPLCHHSQFELKYC